MLWEVALWTRQPALSGTNRRTLSRRISSLGQPDDNSEADHSEKTRKLERLGNDRARKKTFGKEDPGIAGGMCRHAATWPYRSR
jgi:hypothetical protein